MIRVPGEVFSGAEEGGIVGTEGTSILTHPLQIAAA